VAVTSQNSLSNFVTRKRLAKPLDHDKLFREQAQNKAQV